MLYWAFAVVLFCVARTLGENYPNALLEQQMFEQAVAASMKDEANSSPPEESDHCKVLLEQCGTCKTWFENTKSCPSCSQHLENQPPQKRPRKNECILCFGSSECDCMQTAQVDGTSDPPQHTSPVEETLSGQVDGTTDNMKPTGNGILHKRMNRYLKPADKHSAVKVQSKPLAQCRRLQPEHPFCDLPNDADNKQTADISPATSVCCNVSPVQPAYSTSPEESTWSRARTPSTRPVHYISKQRDIGVEVAGHYNHGQEENNVVLKEQRSGSKLHSNAIFREGKSEDERVSNVRRGMDSQ